MAINISSESYVVADRIGEPCYITKGKEYKIIEKRPSRRRLYAIVSCWRWL